MSGDRRGVTLVTGTPRSGTSLVMQMLRAGDVPLLCDDTRPADASNPRGYFEYAPVRRTRRDVSWLAHAEGRAVKVIDALVPCLPPERAYRVIEVRRPLSEVLASQRRMLRRAGAVPPVEDDAPLARAFEAQREAMERWVLREACAPLLRLEYAEIVADAGAAAARISEFLGGGLDVGAMAAAVDPSLYRERAGDPGLTRPATTPPTSPAPRR